MISKEAVAVKEWLKSNVKYGVPAKTLGEVRKRIEGFGEAFILPEDVKLTNEEADVDYGKIKWERITEESCNNKRIILFVHGGGGIMGSAKASRQFAVTLMKTLETSVISIDYRLAPEYPFPSGIEDVKNMILYIKKEIKPDKLIIIGESAGCSLGIGALIKLRNEGMRMADGIVLITPWADTAKNGGSRYTLSENDPWYNKESIESFAGEIYRGSFSDKNVLVSPVHADLHDFPKMLIHAASEDMFLDDAVRIHNNAIRDKVDSKIEVWNGMFHIWHSFGAILPEAIEALSKIKIFCRTL